MSSLQQIDLVAMAHRVNVMHRKASEAAIAAVETAIELGAALLAVKAELPHGAFGQWIEKNCEFSDRTARGYMRLAKAVPTLDESKRQRVADLPLRAALAELVDKPDTTPTEIAVVAVVPHQPPSVNTELTEEQREIVERIAAPFGALMAFVEDLNPASQRRVYLSSEYKSMG